MADEYIKRKDVVNALWQELYIYEDKTEKQFKEDPNLETGEWFDHRIFVQACHAECLEGVLAIPSADVQPVVHGEWLVDVYAKDERTGHEYLVFKCSECGCGCVSRNNFCHRCGADMRSDGGA